MEIKTGNLLETSIPIIAHVVNCHGVMGAGVARQIRGMYPDVYKDYKAYCDGFAKSAYKKSIMLGKETFSFVDNNTKCIFNLFAQFDFGVSKRQLNYAALTKSLISMIEDIKSGGPFLDFGKRIAIPYKLGCGLAGGHWDIVREILTDIEDLTGVEFVAYKLGNT